MWWKSDEGKLKIWYQDVDSSQWVDALPAGIQLGDISVHTDTAGTAALSYDNTTGVLTFTPPDLSNVQGGSIDLTAFSVISNAVDSFAKIDCDANIGIKFKTINIAIFLIIYPLSLLMHLN